MIIKFINNFYHKFISFLTKENSNGQKSKLKFLENFKNLKINVDFQYIYEKNNETNNKFMHLIPAKV